MPRSRPASSRADQTGSAEAAGTISSKPSSPVYPVRLASVSTPNFAVIWDPTVDGGNELQINDLRVAGGQITIKGRIYSTSQGELNALGNYGNLNITNNTDYDLLVHNVDASQKGAGIIQIIDLNQTASRNGITYDKETTYLAQSATHMQVQTQYVDVNNRNAVFIGAVGDSANPLGAWTMSRIRRRATATTASWATSGSSR